MSRLPLRFLKNGQDHLVIIKTITSSFYPLKSFKKIDRDINL